MTNLISANWRFAPLKRIAYVDNSGSYGLDAGQEQVDLPVATTAQISPLGEFESSIMPIRSFSLGDCQRYKCVDGDILVVKSSGSASNIISGKAGLVRKTTPTFIFSNFLLRVRPDQRKTSPSFLYRFLTSSVTRQRVELMCSTTTYPNIKVPEYISAIVPCPPLDEQIAIAEFLDRETVEADALVAKYKRLIKLLEEKRVALITQAVTKGLDRNAPMKNSGVEWIGSVPKHWEVRALRHLGTFKSGSGFPDSEQGNLSEEIGFYKVGDLQSADKDGSMGNPVHTVSRDTANRLGATIFQEGAIVFAKVGAALMLNRYRLLSASSCLDNNMMAFVITDGEIMETQYALPLMPLLDLKRIVNPGAVPSVNASQMKAELIPVPPRPEQVRIAQFIAEQMEVSRILKQRCEAAISLLKERRAALITAAVTGQIDVTKYKSQGVEVVA